MLSLHDELQLLRGAADVDDARVQRRQSLESGLQFSVHVELRLLFYVAVMLVVGAAGLMVARNLRDIGPVMLVVLLLLAAAGCYAQAWRTRRLGRERSLGGDYVLLLGALLLSTAAGYAEVRFGWAGRYWSLQLALLALLHAAGAYYFGSRLLLSVSLAAVAAWFGIETGPRLLSHWEWPAAQLGWRALCCAGTVFFWRAYHGQQARGPGFDGVLEHAVAHLALLGCVALASGAWPWLGALLAVALGVASVRWGQACREPLFIAYGIVYATIAIDCCLLRQSGSWRLDAVIVLLTTCGAALLLWRLLARLREAR